MTMALSDTPPSQKAPYCQMTLSVTRGKRAFHFALDATLAGITAIVGESGAGKSTLALALAGLLPAQGRLQVGEKTWIASDEGLFVPAYRRGVAMVFQDHRLFPHLRVEDNLTLAARWGGRQSPLSVEEVSDFFEITPFLRRYPASLSGGEAQRVSLARAVLAAQDLLILDEALASLDPPRRARLLATVCKLPSLIDVPILMITHQLDEALAVSQCAWGLRDGTVVTHGPRASVLHDMGFMKEGMGEFRERDEREAQEGGEQR